MNNDEATHSEQPQIGPEDLTLLRNRYSQERNRRNYGSYVAAEGRFANFGRDPYADEVSRPAVSEKVDVAIVGGGFSGMLSAVQLRKAGVEDFRIFEKAADFGGTWYWNRYPGVACDVESYIYMPLLEELDTIPSEKYAKGGEILDHSRKIGRQFDLYSRALFQTQVTSVEWDEGIGRWRIRSDRDDEVLARFVILGSGVLSLVRLPELDGIDAFEGHMFHTSRWDYAYTGGSPKGDLVNLADKRVAIIGTGATAIQCIPHLAKSAKELIVIQRTPSTVEPRGNSRTDVEWFSSLARQPGWQKARMENFDGILAGVVQADYQVGDRWNTIWSVEHLVTEEEKATLSPEELWELTDVRRMDEVRRHIEATVKDPKTADALKPYYGRFCKRPTFNDEYLECFNRESVTLVDTKGRGVDKLTPKGIVANGHEYEVDCIIFATGFELGARSDRGGGFSLKGRDGRTLDETWAGGMRSLHGIMTHGFPNMFIVNGLRQAAVTINVPYVFSEQARHVAAIIAELHRRPEKVFEVSTEAEDAWLDCVKAKSTYNAVYVAACTPGNFSAAGKIGEEPIFAAAYGGGPIEYIQTLDDWRHNSIDEDIVAR